jgi:iron-sulfur cluster repair protein YtfE (RIC family)
MTVQELTAAHAPLMRELAELRGLARQVLDAHRAQDGRRLHEVFALVVDLLEDLDLHLRDEEQASFAPRRELRRDHAQVRLLLADLRRHTEGSRVPADAYVTWCALWRGLAAFEDALLRQMRREDDFARGGPLDADGMS